MRRLVGAFPPPQRKAPTSRRTPKNPIVVSAMPLKLTIIIIGILLLLTSSVIGGSHFAPAPESCRSRSDVAGKCFKVHGRLSVYNGTPSIRLWPIGTKRLLGIIDPTDPSNAPGPTVLPVEIKNKLDWDKDVLGEFLVCPLTHQQPSKMQTVCIESGKNLIERAHKLTSNSRP